MRVSVILPCYNGADTLAVQLDALARQTYGGEWELVFVNNGSTDRSVEIAENYRGKIPNLRVINAWSGEGPRRAVTHSYATGFRAALGDLFIACEADDEVADDYIEALVRALDSCDFAVAALDYQKLNPPELTWGPDGGPQTRQTGLISFSGPLYKPYGILCGFGMTRACYETVGEPDEAMGPVWDMDYSWRVQRAGLRFSFAPEALVNYRLRRGAAARFRQSRSWGRAQVAIHQRYGLQPWPRYAAYSLFHLIKSSLICVGGTLLRIRPYEYWVWAVGFAWGQLMGLPAYVRATLGQLPAPPPPPPAAVIRQPAASPPS